MFISRLYHAQIHIYTRIIAVANASRCFFLVTRVVCVEAIIGERAAGKWARRSEAKRARSAATRRRKYGRIFLMNPTSSRACEYADASRFARTRRAAPLSTLATSIQAHASVRLLRSLSLFLLESHDPRNPPFGEIISNSNENTHRSPVRFSKKAPEFINYHKKIKC